MVKFQVYLCINIVYSKYECGLFYGCEGVQHSAPNSTRTAFSRPKDFDLTRS